MGCFQSKPADTHDGTNKGLAYTSAFPNGVPRAPTPRTPEAELEDLELNPSGAYDDDDSTSEPPTSSSDDDLFLEDSEEGNNLPSTSKGGRPLGIKSTSFRKTNKLNVGILEGTTFLNNYIVVDTLGRGSFGKVKLCLSIEDDSLYAVKVVDKRLIKQVAKARHMNKRFGNMKAPTSHHNAGHQQPASTGNHLADLRREVDIMRALNHPNLVKLYEVIDDKVSGKILMVVEFCEAGALVSPGQLTPERRMPEAIAQFYFRQMVSGIAYLHENGVIHGDMKPENVLLAGDATVKIADFGQSQFMSGGEDTLRRTLGTPAFLAPEICAGEDYRGRSADVWALGVSLYGFIYGELPFKGESLMELYDDIADASVPFPPSVAVSIELQDLLLRTLHKDPEARITAAEMLTHPWVREDDLFTLMPSLFSEEAMMEGVGGGGGGGFGGFNLDGISPRQFSPRIGGGGGGGGGGEKSVSSDGGDLDAINVSSPHASGASRSASDAASLPSPAAAARAPSPADVAAAVFPSLFSMRRRNTSGGSSKGSGKRSRGIGGGVSGSSIGFISEGDELGGGAFTLGPQESIIGALQQAHHPNKLGAHPSGRLHLLATDSMVKESLENDESGDGDGDGGGNGVGGKSFGDFSSTSGKSSTGSGKKKNEIQRQDTGRPDSFSGSGKYKKERAAMNMETLAEADAGTSAGASDINTNGKIRVNEGSNDDEIEKHKVEVSKPSAFTVMAQQAQKIQAEMIAKRNSTTTATPATTPTPASDAYLNHGDVQNSGKLETIGEEGTDDVNFSSTISTDEQYGSLLSAPSDSYEIIDAPIGHATGPPPLSPVTEEEESENLPQKKETQRLGGKSRETSAVMIPTSGSSGLTEISWTTSRGVQQSSQSLTFGFGSGGDSLTIASPFDAPDPKPSMSFITPNDSSSIVGDADAAHGEDTFGANDSKTSPKTAAELVKAGAAAAAAAVQSTAPTSTAAPGAAGEIEENPPPAVPSSSPPRGKMYNLLHRLSFKGSGAAVDDSTTDSQKNTSEQSAPPPPPLSTLHSGGSTRSAPEIPPIQWRMYQPGQKLFFFNGHNHANTCYYVESGMVELRWEATLAVPLTRVLSTMQHPSQKFKESTSNNSTTSGGSSNSRNEYLNRIDSVALAANKVTTLQASATMRPGSAGSNAASGPGMDRSETMANTLQQAAERAEALMVNATGGSLDNLLLSHRGPSQFVGALSMLDPEFFADRWKASAIAQTELVVIQMTREGLDVFLAQNPLAQVHLRASMARGQAEIIKLEALERIADAHRRKRYVKPVQKKASWKLSDMKGAFGVTMAEATEVALGPLAEISSKPSMKPAREGDASSAQETAGLDVFALVSKLRNETQGVASWTDLLDTSGNHVNGELTKISDLVDRAALFEDWLVDTRRELHQYPELMFEEFNTSAIIRRHLDDMKIPYKYPVAKTGLVATIGSGSPIIALRADIDALPIDEESGVSFPSQHPGVMHACGHDGHITMLLGAAKLLKERELELKGTVKLLFQPAEEGGAGGDLMVKEGALKGVDAAFGLHLWPGLPTGVLGTRPGTILAGAIQFKVTIIGAGGHGAIPHLTRDPVVAAASAVSALQTLVSRGTSPFASAVVSVTKLWAGGAAYNVIPDEAHFGGTMRATTDEDMINLRARLEKVVQGQAESFGCTSTVDWMEETMPYYPPLVNDARTADFMGKVAGEVLGESHVIPDVEPTMAGEDFAFIARAVPSAFAFLGIRNETVGSTHGLHTAQYMMDEGALKIGAAVHTAVVLRYMDTGGDVSKLVVGGKSSDANNVKDEL